MWTAVSRQSARRFRLHMKQMSFARRNNLQLETTVKNIEIINRIQGNYD